MNTDKKRRSDRSEQTVPEGWLLRPLPGFEPRLPVVWAFGQEGETLLYVFSLRFDIDFGNGCVCRQKRAVDELPLFAGFDIFVREAQVFEVAICQVAHPRVVLFAQLVKGADGLKGIRCGWRFRIGMKFFW